MYIELASRVAYTVEKCITKESLQQNRQTLGSRCCCCFVSCCEGVVVVVVVVKTSFFMFMYEAQSLKEEKRRTVRTTYVPSLYATCIKYLKNY